jgi:hypothetical protein
MFRIPSALSNILRVLESSDFFKSMLLGFTPDKGDRISDTLLIRNSNYKDVQIEDLLFILDEDFNSLIGPNYLLDNDLRVLLRISNNKQ